MKNVRLSECDNNGVIPSDGYTYIVSLDDYIKLRNESKDGFVCLNNGWFMDEREKVDVIEYARVDRRYVSATDAPEGIYSVDEDSEGNSFPEPTYSEFEELWSKVEACTKVKVED